ncbi:hypothetical protein NPIL_55691 [Nephila pilipes]|uniref:Uncharacterized protein n=1 Tax=Nephila pilipes TaxID=299642 RepID=A0A8X6QHX4_NEPPI|nr:hypothetical protein NPIL_55691 [Nephila pilipes]
MRGPSALWDIHLLLWIRRGEQEHGVTPCVPCVPCGRNRPRWCVLTPMWIPSPTWNTPALARCLAAA